MSPLVRLLLLGGSMALSAVTLFWSSTGCLCIGEQCVDPARDAAKDTTCCSKDGTYYWSCDVALQNDPPSVLTAAQVPVTGCFDTYEDAQRGALGLAEAMYSDQYPNTHAGGAACSVAFCPGGGP